MSALQAALKSGVHRARFGVKQTPGPSQVTNPQNVIQFDPGSLFQSQSEQSGSEQDSAVESPVVDSVDSDSQQVLVNTQRAENVIVKIMTC